MTHSPRRAKVSRTRYGFDDSSDASSSEYQNDDELHDVSSQADFNEDNYGLVGDDEYTIADMPRDITRESTRGLEHETKECDQTPYIPPSPEEKPARNSKHRTSHCERHLDTPRGHGDHEHQAKERNRDLDIPTGPGEAPLDTFSKRRGGNLKLFPLPSSAAGFAATGQSRRNANGNHQEEAPANGFWACRPFKWLGDIAGNLGINNSINSIVFMIAILLLVFILGIVLLVPTVPAPSHTVTSSFACISSGVTSVITSVAILFSKGSSVTATPLADPLSGPYETSWESHNHPLNQPAKDVAIVDVRSAFDQVSLKISEQLERDLIQMWDGSDVIKKEVDIFEKAPRNFGAMLALHVLVDLNYSDEMHDAIRQLQISTPDTIGNFIMLLRASRRYIEAFRRGAFHLVTFAEDAIEQRDGGIMANKHHLGAPAADDWETERLIERMETFTYRIKLVTHEFKNLIVSLRDQVRDMTLSNHAIERCAYIARTTEREQIGEKTNQIFGWFRYREELASITLSFEWCNMANNFVRNIRDIIVTLEATTISIKDQVNEWKKEPELSGKLLQVETLVRFGSEILSMVDRIDPDGGELFLKESG